LVKKDGRAHNETLKAGGYFGQEVLVDGKQYTATVLALQTTACFQLDMNTLKQTIGTLKVKRGKSANNVA
jgi:CRP-like cAMP-binding protein